MLYYEKIISALPDKKNKCSNSRDVTRTIGDTLTKKNMK